jgi:hypothetical protein
LRIETYSTIFLHIEHPVAILLFLNQSGLFGTEFGNLEGKMDEVMFETIDEVIAYVKEKGKEILRINPLSGCGCPNCEDWFTS